MLYEVITGMAKVAEKATLKQKLFEKIQAHRPRTTKLNKEFGNVIIDQVTIAQAIGGARGIRSLVKHRRPVGVDSVEEPTQQGDVFLHRQGG